jgi:hypothetical protein
MKSGSLNVHIIIGEEPNEKSRPYIADLVYEFSYNERCLEAPS